MLHHTFDLMKQTKPMAIWSADYRNWAETCTLQLIHYSPAPLVYTSQNSQIFFDIPIFLNLILPRISLPQNQAQSRESVRKAHIALGAF